MNPTEEEIRAARIALGMDQRIEESRGFDEGYLAAHAAQSARIEFLERALGQAKKRFDMVVEPDSNGMAQIVVVHAMWHPASGCPDLAKWLEEGK